MMLKKKQQKNSMVGSLIKFALHTYGFKKCFIVTAILFLIIALITALLTLSVTSFTKSRTVQLGLKNVGQLVTQTGYFTNIQKIQDAREVWGITIPFTENQYIFTYDGSVDASIDFSAIDVEINDISKTITVTLPNEVTLDVYVDHDSMEIYDESKNIFTPLTLERINDSLSALEEEVRNKAISNGIEEAARTNAKNLLQIFIMNSVNTKDYDIIFAE